MLSREEKLKRLDNILNQIIVEWYERVKTNFVTEEDSRELGLEPEIKLFHETGNHRIKFSRVRELDVTYGLAAKDFPGSLHIESSVNNKSSRFDYDTFVDRLESYYWRSRHEKPWTQQEFDRFAYGDLLRFDPRMGHSVSLDIRPDKADIIRLSFRVNPRYEDLLMQNGEVLRDLVENYCLAPLKRIYAESYRE
jgi:hypothetical protein